MTASLVADLHAFAAAGVKEFRILRRYPTLFLGFLFWPIVLPFSYVLQARGFAGGNAAAEAAFATRAGTADVVGFLFLGFTAYMWISMILWGPGTALRTEQVRGSLEALFLTPASRLVILFGPAFSQIVWALYMFGLVGIAMVFVFGIDIGLVEAIRALVIIAVATPALYGMGALFASVVLRFGEVGALVQTVRGIFTAFCGMTFPIIVLPEWGRAVALALPPTYLIGGLRSALLTGTDLVALIPDMAFLLASGLFLCAAAVVAFRSTERYARRGGSLAQY